MDAIKYVQENNYETKNFPEFKAGDTVECQYKIVEGDKERIQNFKGDVIQVKGHGAAKTFTVRKISNGVGVERIFPYATPNLVEVKVLKRGKVRQSRIYYLRDRVGKKARIKERKNY